MSAPGSIHKFVSKAKEQGIFSALKATLVVLLYHLLRRIGLIDAIITKHRAMLSDQIATRLNSTVTHGPFKGMRLPPEMAHGGRDKAAMLLGLYEQEILTSLQHIPSRYSTFIDLGAADGYYGIGVLVGGIFDKSYCFEMSAHGRDVIRKNALLNGVADRVEIRGIAERDFYQELAAQEIKRSVVLIDIEGGEFDLLDSTSFNALRNSIIFIELHDSFFADGKMKLAKLKGDAKSTHTISQFATSSRDLSGFEELKNHNDTDRWLLCSEGRPRLMSWLRLDPLVS